MSIRKPFNNAAWTKRIIKAYEKDAFYSKVSYEQKEWMYLHSAGFYGDEKIAKAFLKQYKPHIEKEDKYALSMLRALWIGAAGQGQTHILALLMKNGVDVDFTVDKSRVRADHSPDPVPALTRAAEGGHAETVLFLLQNGANVHALEGCALRTVKREIAHRIDAVAAGRELTEGEPPLSAEEKAGLYKTLAILEEWESKSPAVKKGKAPKAA